MSNKLCVIICVVLLQYYCVTNICSLLIKLIETVRNEHALS